MSDKVRKVASKAFTRPANTTAYASGDIVANSVTAGSVVPIELKVARVPGGSGTLKTVEISKTDPSVTNAAFRVHFFENLPVVAAGDNAAFSAAGRAADFLGTVDVTVAQAYSDGAAGVATCEIMFDCPIGSDKIYALVEARGAYTPASAETITLTVGVLRDGN